MTVPTVDLEASKALDQAATPGPWQAYDANGGTSSPPAWSVCNDAYVNPLGHPQDAPAIDITVTYGSREDAELIAAGRNALPAPVAEVERLRAELAETKVTLHLTEQELLNFRENIEWLRGELQIGKDALINAHAVASDRIADRDRICRDVMAERDEARAALARLETTADGPVA